MRSIRKPLTRPQPCCGSLNARNSAMWVVKLGGSLSESPHLRHWLEALADHGGGRTVIVPGGGRFADQVRRMQLLWGVDDPCAHRMALLAMEQFGLLMHGIRQRLIPARDLPEIRQILAAGDVAVWLPYAMTIAEKTIPCDWTVTSDSLAAWLTARLGAQRLLLVKSLGLPPQDQGVGGLVRDGLVDQAFPGFMARAGCPVDWLSVTEHARLAGWLEGRIRAVELCYTVSA
ncbi:MAG: amino acid kinase [Thioalkalivibrio sp.]